MEAHHSAKYQIQKDLYRAAGNVSMRVFLGRFMSDPGFKFLCAYRLCQKHKRASLFGFFSYLFFRRYTHKYGIQIPLTVKIGPGMHIPHFGGIVVNSRATIGKNCTLMQNVTIGNTKGGKNPGTPVIGDNAYIGPGAAVVGNIQIGDNVLIAPNAFVNIDIPSDSLVIGNPVKVIPKQNASCNYINNPV